MQEQIFPQTGGKKETETESDFTFQLPEVKAVNDFNVDALLDNIEELLETNASAFVQGFVQKGGQ